METTETYSSNNRYWWLMLIIGILSILCGIWVFRNPVESYFALAVYFSIMFILYGIGEIVNAFAGQRYRNWGWGLAVGILDLVIGFILLGNLAWAADLLPYVVGFILMFVGIGFIGQSSQMQSFRIDRRNPDLNFCLFDYFPSAFRYIQYYRMDRSGLYFRRYIRHFLFF